MDQITIYRVQRLSVTVVVLYCTYSIVDLWDPKIQDLHAYSEKGKKERKRERENKMY